MVPQWRIAVAPRPRITTASWREARTSRSPTISTRAAATTAATATPRTSGRSIRCLASCTSSNTSGPASNSRGPNGSWTGRNFRYIIRIDSSEISYRDEKIPSSPGTRDKSSLCICHLSCHVTEGSSRQKKLNKYQHLDNMRMFAIE